MYLSPPLFNGFLLSNQTSFQFSIYNLPVHDVFKQMRTTRSADSPDMGFESFQQAPCSSYSAPM